MKKVFFLLGMGLSCFVLSAQDHKALWTDSVFHTLTVQEKIGQLFMIPVSTYLSREAEAGLADKIKTYHVGGLYVTGGGPTRSANLLNHMQRITKVPLLVGMNAAWGLGQTLDSTMSFLRPMALGAIKNDSLIYHLGETIALQMKMLGMHINFAPQVGLYHQELDYQNYYSDSKEHVAATSVSLIHGLQDNGVIACARQISKAKGKLTGLKDSVIYFELDRMDTSGFYPYLQLVRSGVGGLLTNYFNFSMLDNKKSVPAEVSSVFITEIIKKKIGFKGLTFTKVSELQKISGNDRKGEPELLAFMVGNDVLIAPENLNAALRKILKAVGKNAALMAQLDESVKKILGAKYDAGLAGRNFVNRDNLIPRLNPPDALLFKHQLAEAAITVVRNDSSVIPIRSLQGKTFASVTVGATSQNDFNRYLAKYEEIQKFSFRRVQDTTGLEARLRATDVIIVGVFSAVQPELLPILRRLASKKEVIVCVFGNPLGIKVFEKFPSVMVAYSDDNLVQEIAAQIIFGGLGGHGVLPITVTPSCREGQGVITSSYDRLSYSVPEAAGMDSQTLEQIESIAHEAIDIKATPGCHVLVARNGKVVYEQSFGALTYENKTPVTDTTLYDLASVTKVSATLQTVMYMYEKGLIDVNKKASLYLPELRTSNKKDFILKDILTHQSGLWPFLPFWTETVRDSIRSAEYYSSNESADYPFPVASHLFASKAMKDSLWQWIIRARIQEKTGHNPYDYKYSDMGFYILQHLAEKLLHQPMEEFLKQNIYEPLGAYSTGYLPLRKFPAAQIAPTEDDKLFRKSLLIGYVHDQGAAMHGGIAGHAGLFSTANDLAKLGQMWLQKGSYGHHRYFRPETIEFFTQKQYENSRRGLGWDKPTPSDPNGPTSILASPRTFGHTGFTGISIWIDPEFDLVFIFFSNRVYPDMNNTKILNANIRPRIQDVVYRSIFKYCENHN